MEYKEEYLQLAKNAKSLEELAKTLETTEQQIITWATHFSGDVMTRADFFEVIRNLKYPEEKSVHAGQPTKFKEDYIDATPYLEGCGRENTKLPTIEGYAIHLGVHRDTLYAWAKLNKEFSDTLRLIEHLQKEQLINDGIYGGKEVNATIVKLLLQNNHGMKEKTDVTTNNKDIPNPIYNGKSIEE